MNQQVANQKVQDVFASLCSVLTTNETLFERIIADLNLSPTQTLATCYNFCQLLVLKHLHPGELVEPTVTIDTVWHQFILHTEAYQAFCLQNFGTYMHHRPTVSGHSIERTFELLKETFGLDINAK